MDGADLTAPVSATSPTNADPAEGRTPVAAEASAAAMARSHAGSSRRTPPEDAPNSSRAAERDARPAVEDGRHELEPARIEPGGLTPGRTVRGSDERLDLHGERPPARLGQRDGRPGRG